MKTLFTNGKHLALKTALLILLAGLSFNAFACGGCNPCHTCNTCNTCTDCVYVGNPYRPYTVWIPEHCCHGRWIAGHYVQYICPPVTCRHIYWDCDHWQPCHVCCAGWTDSQV